MACCTIGIHAGSANTKISECLSISQKTYIHIEENQTASSYNVWGGP